MADPTELAPYVGYGPADAPRDELVRVAGTRWTIEDCFADAKGEVGLDHHAGRRWDGWYRHITRCLVAHAVLAVRRAVAENGGASTTR